jgi:hypothetical protein
MTASNLRVHAIMIALNEEDFINEALAPLYPVCSGISVITQYDRDYYKTPVAPDTTVPRVLSFPDPEGKLSLVVRRYIDETVSRNHEMATWLTRPYRGVLPHAWPVADIEREYQPPDYFLIVDADEIFDVDTFPRMVEYLAQKRPRGMRVSAYEYGKTWNRRVPAATYLHHQFGFVRAGVFFESRREVTFNEHRLKKALGWFHLPKSIASRAWGFIDCPRDVGMFHHGAYIRRNRARLLEKISKHSHRTEFFNESWVDRLMTQPYDHVPTEQLPRNIQVGTWPAEFFETSGA